MNHYLLYLAAAFSVIIVLRLLIFRRRLPDSVQILEELERIPCKISIDDQDMWSLARDMDFWADIHGFRGLLMVRRKANRLRDFVRSLELSPEDHDDLKFLSHRCYFITGLVGIQLLLSPFKTPHFFARWAVGLYGEMRTRSLTICREYNQGLYHSLRAHA